MSTEWIEHDGTGFPGIDPRTFVVVQFRDEPISAEGANPRPAHYWGACWTLIDKEVPTSPMNHHCIARYRIVEGNIE